MSGRQATPTSWFQNLPRSSKHPPFPRCPVILSLLTTARFRSSDSLSAIALATRGPSGLPPVAGMLKSLFLQPAVGFWDMTKTNSFLWYTICGLLFSSQTWIWPSISPWVLQESSESWTILNHQLLVNFSFLAGSQPSLIIYKHAMFSGHSWTTTHR